MHGNGTLSKQEAKHFCDKYIRKVQGLDYVPDERFQAWFKSLDKDGDGHIDMAEMALYLKQLSEKLERDDVMRTTDYDSTFGLKTQKNKRPLTVADVIGT